MSRIKNRTIYSQQKILGKVVNLSHDRSGCDTNMPFLLQVDLLCFETHVWPMLKWSVFRCSGNLSPVFTTLPAVLVTMCIQTDCKTPKTPLVMRVFGIGLHRDGLWSCLINFLVKSKHCMSED